MGKNHEELERIHPMNLGRGHCGWVETRRKQERGCYWEDVEYGFLEDRTSSQIGRAEKWYTVAVRDGVQTVSEEEYQASLLNMKWFGEIATADEVIAAIKSQ